MISLLVSESINLKVNVEYNRLDVAECFQVVYSSSTVHR